MIRELRILPPLAIARFGAAATPMDNYDATVDPDRPLGYRQLRPAETFEVDPATGEIARAFVPAGSSSPRTPSFGRSRFLELWALTDDDQLEPVTADLLAEDQASVADLRWRVEWPISRSSRRTDDDADRVTADSGDIDDHTIHPLAGVADNFWPDKSIPFGSVQFIRPTAAHPEIRLRFTRPGFVYGASRTRPPAGPPADPNVRDIVYDANRGGWLGYEDSDPQRITVPGQIYALDAQGSSRGYLDDGCDGLVRASLRVRGQTLRAFARVGVGHPRTPRTGCRSAAWPTSRAGAVRARCPGREGSAGAGRGDCPAGLRDGSADEHRDHERSDAGDQQHGRARRGLGPTSGADHGPLARRHGRPGATAPEPARRSAQRCGAVVRRRAT